MILFRKSIARSFPDLESTFVSLLEKELYSYHSKKKGGGAHTFCAKDVWVEPVPEDASEDDLVVHFVYVIHEVSHNTEGSDISLVPSVKILKIVNNGLEDVRCEKSQCIKHNGLSKYYARFYEIKAERSWCNTFANAAFEDMPTLIHNMVVYLKGKMRAKQLGIDIDWTPSADMLDAYNRCVIDLEDTIDNLSSSKEARDLADVIYERIKKMIEEEKEKQDNEQEQGDSTEDSDNQESDSDGGEPEDSDDSEDSQESSGEDDSEDSTEDSDETPEDSSNSEDADGDDSEADNGEDDKAKEEELKRLIDKINEEVDDSDLMDEVRKEIKQSAVDANLYYAGPGVRDIIKDNRSGTIEEARYLQQAGIKLLGPAGSRMTRYMITHTKPRTRSGLRSGRLSMNRVAADVHDQSVCLYNKTFKGSLDKAAVEILVDNSGSMRGVKELAYAILSGILYHLDKSRIPSEAIGYTALGTSSSEYRDLPVILSFIKKFDEAFKGKALLRCVPPSAYEMKYTSEIDCMRFAVPRLLQRKEAKKILFVIGDGQPELNNATLTGRNRIAYKTYIEQCKAMGITVFGFGIGCDLSHFFGKDFVSITSENMGTVIANKLTEVLNRRR